VLPTLRAGELAVEDTVFGRPFKLLKFVTIACVLSSPTIGGRSVKASVVVVVSEDNLVTADALAVAVSTDAL
jgi:hypothetical protein